VPYGELLPPEEVGADDCPLWLLNTDMFRHGAIGERVFNRPTLRLS
jgi:hypothetical protein